MDGRQLTEKIFEKTGTKVSVIRSFFYIKYWNYNKSAGTHRLRPWTTDRRSLWTMMEAAQQAYSTVIRKEKGKTFWLLFRIPFIFRFLGSILAGLFIYLGITSGDKDAINALWLIISFVILFIFYWIADAGKLYVLWKNVYPMIESIGFTKEELKAVKRIYLIRMIYATLMVIYEIIKLALKIAQKVAKEKK